MLNNYSRTARGNEKRKRALLFVKCIEEKREIPQPQHRIRIEKAESKKPA
jgi:hypothetical protein